MVVRNDISPAQKAVQASHAAILAARTFLDKLEQYGPFEESPNLVICTVENDDILNEEFFRVLNCDISCVMFHEADMDNQTTAFATRLVSGDERKVFSKLKLLK